MAPPASVDPLRGEKRQEGVRRCSGPLTSPGRGAVRQTYGKSHVEPNNPVARCVDTQQEHRQQCGQDRNHGTEYRHIQVRTKDMPYANDELWNDVHQCKHCSGQGSTSCDCCATAAGVPAGSPGPRTNVCCACLGAGEVLVGLSSFPEPTQCRHCGGSGSTGDDCCRIASGCRLPDPMRRPAFPLNPWHSNESLCVCCACRGTGMVPMIDPLALGYAPGPAVMRRMHGGGGMIPQRPMLPSGSEPAEQDGCDEEFPVAPWSSEVRY